MVYTQLRHHPVKGTDNSEAHKQMFASLRRLASIERGRREFLARELAIQDAFVRFGESHSPNYTSAETPESFFRGFCHYLDDVWHLEGKCVSSFALVCFPRRQSTT